MGISACSIQSMTHATQPWICDRNDNLVWIIDDSASSHVKSIDNTDSIYSKQYIKSLSDFVSSGFPANQPCTVNSRAGPSVKLIFIRFPLVTSGNAPLPVAPKLDPALQGATCQLDSPWLKLLIYYSDRSTIQGLFIWNERQFLLDQLLLSGGRPRENYRTDPSAFQFVQSVRLRLR